MSMSGARAAPSQSTEKESESVPVATYLKIRQFPIPPAPVPSPQSASLFCDTPFAMKTVLCPVTVGKAICGAVAYPVSAGLHKLPVCTGGVARGSVTCSPGTYVTATWEIESAVVVVNGIRNVIVSAFRFRVKNECPNTSAALSGSNLNKLVEKILTVSPPLGVTLDSAPAKLTGSTLTITESARPLLWTVILVRPGATAVIV